MKRWLIEDKYAGRIKKVLYRQMQRRFDFGPWHISPINERPYALEVYRTLNLYIDKALLPHKPIVEVGCGMGEIIGSLKWDYGKLGIDLSANVLKAAKLLHSDISFQTGTFTDVKIGEVSCLIMLNFIHAIPYDVLKKYIDEVLKNNTVEMFVFDTFRNSRNTEYIYSHDGDELFGGKYELFKRSGGFLAAHGAKRYVEYWRIKGSR